MKHTPWTTAGLLALALTGCGEEGEGRTPLSPGDLDPPSHPVHDRDEDGFRHARRNETPYLCGDPGGGGAVTCPTDGRPAPDDLSCDAAGCHGGYDYTPDGPRHLEGSDGPSCWTCHDQEWGQVQ